MNLLTWCFAVLFSIVGCLITVAAALQILRGGWVMAFIGVPLGVAVAWLGWWLLRDLKKQQ